ncbi:MAG: tRNA (adenosine(37)-N6)-threonylcarbamoyltransferase complex transferase subunit TsaD [Bacteroidaceae bacterium]|nr:tRNA (adenosine(37)-N6)-threonylcarbamoyltransferase complex transferase subunit TsaD [Bacteroidaceae bacterium]
MAAALNIPMIDVNHLQGHVLAHFIRQKTNDDNFSATGKVTSLREATMPKGDNAPAKEESGIANHGKSGVEENIPPFPFLCLLVSGGNSQIVLVKAYNDMEIIGQTIDDAAGEAIDKCSKLMGLGYPGGPIIDRLARKGNPETFHFSEPHIPRYDYSFSGLKTSFLYSLRDWMKDDPDFIEHNKEDLAASLEHTVVSILMKKLRLAAKDLKIRHVAVAGGVSANTGLRQAFKDYALRYHWHVYIPPFSFTTDNAAMIAIAGYFKYQDHDFCPMEAPAYSRVSI